MHPFGNDGVIARVHSLLANTRSMIAATAMDAEGLNSLLVGWLAGGTKEDSP